MKKFLANCNSGTFNILFSLVVLPLYNIIFLRKLYAAIEPDFYSSGIVFFLSVLVSMFLITFAILDFLLFKYTAKIFTIIVIVTSGLLLSFTARYNILIDGAMIKNIMQTNIQETLDLLDKSLIIQIVLLIIIPSILILNIGIKYGSFFYELKKRLCRISLCLIIAFSLLYANFQSISFLVRDNRTVFSYFSPLVLLKFIRNAIPSEHSNKQPLKIAEDAKITESDEKLTIVMIVGETARKKNFSLYGYERGTNPLLSQDNVIVMPNTKACGTSTAISVPCMFSHMGKTEFDQNDQNYEFITHLIERLGVKVLYQGNNVGSKGIANDAMNVDFPRDNKFCSGFTCVDGVMLKEFEKVIKNNLNDSMLYILHQNGSHGPKYYERYTSEFEKYTPVCKLSDLKNCTLESIINGYNNSILYTDYFIHQVIEVVRSLNNKAVVIYMSDHGESLGEYGLYLHGFPYKFAPDEQKEVPFLIWLSDNYEKANKINRSCVKKEVSYSHDNLFHTILGLFKVETDLYNNSLDVFYGCKNNDIKGK